MELDKRAFACMTRYAKKIGDGPDSEARLLKRLHGLARQRTGAQLRAVVRGSTGPPQVQ